MAINFLFDVSVNSGIDLQNTSITSLATPINNTDAATKAYVDALVTASDLDFSGTNGTGAVDLDSQVFAVTGGTFISTTASGQSLSIDLNATNSPSATTFLRGDNTWSTPPDNNTTYTFAAVSGTPNLIRLTGTNPSSTNDIGLVATGNIAITFNSVTSLGFDLASSISVANTITAGTGLTVTTGGVNVTGTGTFNTGVSVTGNSSINGELDMSSNKIINVTDPTNAQDAATKNYVDITSTSGAVNFQGGYDAATNTPDLDSNPSSAIKKGWMYTVTADGTFFTEQVRTGDSLIAQIDAPTTLANWTTVQNNIDLADASTVGIGNVAGGTGIGVSYSAGTATVSQDAVTLNQNTSSATPGSGGTFTAIDSVTTDSTGHLTDYNLKTVTLPTATISGSGTANYISKWNTTSALTNSLIYDTGTQLAIGTTSPDSGIILQVGDGTVSEIVRVYDSSNKYVDLNGAGVYFTRTNSYLRPAGTAASQTLYIGDNLGGSNPNRSWGAIRSNFNDFWFTDNGVKVMRIHNENVGIGTGAVYPNSASEKLHVDGNFRLTGSFKDGSNGAGTSGQVLSSTGISTSWISLPADNNNYVTSASFGTGTGVLTLSRQGLTAVTVSLDGRYLTGNQNITLTGDVTGGPSATSIATTISSNVVGANELNVSSNGTSGQVLTSDGLGAFTWSTPVTGDIEGVTAGNGLTGGGTAGTVTLTVGQGTGIQVNATNVALATAGPGAGTYGSTSDSTKIDTITLDAYGRVTSVATGATGSGNVTGSGTASYIPKWSTSTGLTNSIIYDNGTNVGLGTTSPSAKLEVKGSGDGDLFIGRHSSSGAKLIYGYQSSSDGFLELRTGSDSIVTKLSGYTGTPSYFLSNVGIGTPTPARLFHIDSGTTTAWFRLQGGGGFGRYTDMYNNDDDFLLRADASNTGTSNGTVNFAVGLTDGVQIGGSGQVTFWQYGSGAFTGTAAKNLAVDSSGNVIETDGNIIDGSGTINRISKWSDANTLTDSGMSDNGNVIQLDPSRNFNVTRTFGSNNIQSRILVGAGVAAGDLALDVKQKAYVRAGLVVSPNPSGVQVDDSSLVVGAGNNDIVSGSDHCLTVGNGNQIISDSDRSVSFGNNNETKQSDNSMNVGNTNLLKYSNNSHIIGQNNRMGDDYQSGTAGFNNSLVIGSDNILSTDDGSPNPPNGGLSFVIGHDNELRHTENNSFTFGYSIANKGGASTAHRNDFNIGGDLTAVNQTMTLGYRNDASSYPVENNTVGLGTTKFVVAVGSNTAANALLITEGGINKSNTAQVPRIVLPSVVGFNFVNDVSAAAGGIPVGGLYHSSGTLKIRLT